MTPGHTESETRILAHVERGLKNIRANYKDGAFCTGVAWATMNLILGELRLPQQAAPWEQVHRTDEKDSRL